MALQGGRGSSRSTGNALISCRKWLEWRLSSQEIGQAAGSTHLEPGQEDKGREVSRRAKSSATHATPGSCVISRGKHQSR